MKASLPYKYITSVKNGKQYVVFDYKDKAGKRKRKVISAETIARVLDSKKEDSSDESEKMSATPKSMDTKSASNKTTNKPAPKKRGRKKKNNTPADTSQTAAV